MRALAALTSRHRPTTTIAERIALLSASSCASAAWTHKSMLRPRGGGDYARFGVAMWLMLRRGLGGLGW